MAEVRTGSGQRLALGPRLAAGGEGSVHEVAGRSDICAKIYHAPARTPERRAKLQQMLARVPRDPTAHMDHPSLAWPREAVADADGFCGFLMPRVPVGARTALTFLQPEDRGRAYPGFHFRYLLTACRNLASAVAALHEVGACVGDLNESNVMITPTALVTLIDCDSFQVGAHRCPVGKAEYLPPELAGLPLGRAVRTPASDAFALAVLIFQLLMQGFHPFSGRWLGPDEPPDIGRRIRAGLYAYAGRADIAPPPAAPGLHVLPRPVRLAMERAFGPGIADPALRPSPRQWVDLLESAARGVRPCRARPSEHHYPRGLRACPWCALAERGHDYFPEAVGQQVALPAARPPGASGSAVPLPPPPGGRPRIRVEPERLAFDGLERGAPARAAEVTVRNIGKGGFRGRVLVDPPGAAVTVAPTEFYLSPFHGENEQRLTVRADPSHLGWGERRSLAVRVTDGHQQARLRVALTVAEQVAARTALRAATRWGTWGAVAVAAALGVALRHFGPAGGLVAHLRDDVFAVGAPLRPLALWAWCGLVLALAPAAAGRRHRPWPPIARVAAALVVPLLAAWSARAGVAPAALALSGAPLAAAGARAVSHALGDRLHRWAARCGAGALVTAALTGLFAASGPLAAAGALEVTLHLPAGVLRLVETAPPPLQALHLGGLPAGVPADAVLLRLSPRVPLRLAAQGDVTVTQLPAGARYRPGLPTEPVSGALGGTWRYAVLTATRPAAIVANGRTVAVDPRRPVVLERVTPRRGPGGPPTR